MGDDDDELDDDEVDDDEPPVRTGSAGRATSLSSGSRRMAPRPRLAVAAKTINGHPKGPKAEVFNAVTRTAIPNAAPCFAKHARGGGTVSIYVAMTVGNSGTVEEAKASGANNPALRKCIVGVVKRLTYPAFEGPKVKKTIPFTAVSSGR